MIQKKIKSYGAYKSYLSDENIDSLTEAEMSPIMSRQLS